MLGDWGLFDRDDEFKGTQHALFVFVAFSFLIAIVLLNVLIAIIGASYERCLVRSRHLFGRARVHLLAEVVAFRGLGTLLFSQENVNDHRYRKWHPESCVNWIKSIQWSKGGAMAFSIFSVCTIMFWCIAEFFGAKTANSDASMEKKVLISLGTVVLNLVVFVLFLYALSDRPHGSEGNFAMKGVQWLMLCLLGKGVLEEDPKNQHDDLSRQLKEFMEMTRVLNENSEARMLDEMGRFVQKVGRIEGRVKLQSNLLSTIRRELQANSQVVETTKTPPRVPLTNSTKTPPRSRLESF